MPTASIITITTPANLASGSPTTVPINWDVETKYLDGDIDFFDIGSPNLLTVPADPTMATGTIYECFLWVEDNTSNWGGGSGIYLGFDVAKSGRVSWGIHRDAGFPARGIRTGPIEHDGSLQNFSSSVREFETHSFTPSTPCMMGIIAGNPTPLAMAAAQSASFSMPNGSPGVMNLSEELDFGDCYNPATGIYTAPAGAELAVCDLNGIVTSAAGNDVNFILRKNGSQVRAYRPAHSSRGKTPGSFGMLPVTGGDEISFACQDFSSGRTGAYHHSVEFY